MPDLFGAWLRLVRLDGVGTVRLGRRVSARLHFEPRDIWVGLYVERPAWEGPARTVTLYLCLVPMLPIVVDVELENLTDRPLAERDPVVAKWLGGGP